MFGVVGKRLPGSVQLSFHEGYTTTMSAEKAEVGVVKMGGLRGGDGGGGARARAVVCDSLSSQ